MRKRSYPRTRSTRKVQPGEELTFTFTPTEGVFSSAQLNGEDIEFGADELHIYLYNAKTSTSSAFYICQS